MGAASVLADTSFLSSLLSRRDLHPQWAAVQTAALPPPWLTCDAVLSEAFHLLGARGGPALRPILLRRPCRTAFNLADPLSAVLKLMEKYPDVPMSRADGCLVRITDTHAD